VSLSTVARELVWLQLAQPDLVGSVRDFSLLLGRTPEEIHDALRELEPLDCIRASPGAGGPADVAVAFVALDPERERRLREIVDHDLKPAGPVAERPSFGYSADLLGRDPSMQPVYAMIDRVSRTNATVLILGESGVGKEVVARTIHSQSLRADRLFTVIDCAAIPSALLESELFGHERGSFTSASSRQIGKLESADGGTVLLDEIAELPLELQAKLLRVLQTRQFTRVGGNVPIGIDVRFIAATNRRLDRMVTEGTFRRDLYYRLNVVAVTVPPLRERRRDVALLAQRIIAMCSHREGIAPRRLSDEAQARLRAYAWPGNVRELENVLERALIVSEGPVIAAADLALSPAPATADAPRPLKTLRDMEHAYIQHVLRATGGNMSEAARILGLHRDTLYRKLRRFGITPLRQNTTP
jgi:DNA-binding NtrC family response regulator